MPPKRKRISQCAVSEEERNEIMMAAKAQATAEFGDRVDALEAEKQQWELEKEQAAAGIRDREEALEAEKQQWELEHAALHTETFGQIVKLDVGGTRFKTLLSTLQRYPASMIGAMFSGRHALLTDSEGFIFIDSNGAHFQHILDFLRRPEDPRAKLSEGLRTVLEAQATYFGLNELMFPNEEFEHTSGKTIVSDQCGIAYAVTQDLKGIWYAVWDVKVNQATFIERGITDPKIIEVLAHFPVDIKYRLEVCSNCERTAVHQMHHLFKDLFKKELGRLSVQTQPDLLLKDFFKDRKFVSAQPRREFPCTYCLCASSSDESASEASGDDDDEDEE
ncbi:hypothetical protein B484DRAFT_454293 [Ochromonadaceae sp. CCMP2298]|nr:hypothetical protein B484DRAFT_454293 [Ochromonadaceae sp. CCMP2298]|mmetsp:Transcript_26543/g.57251  ORF Transcript_26543/g.57251 Transcript_26543/m.57251 type:complete len:334 (+) Transcript_26543:101-1102(+)